MPNRATTTPSPMATLGTKVGTSAPEGIWDERGDEGSYRTVTLSPVL